MGEVIKIGCIDKYIFEIVSNTLILTPKEINVNETEFCENDFTSSKILNCIVKSGNEIISNKRKHFEIIEDILQSTQKENPCDLLLLETSNVEIKGYKYFEKFGIYVKFGDINKVYDALVNIVKLNNFSIKLKVKLKNKKIINLDILANSFAY